jgi:hypothetical protein
VARDLAKLKSRAVAAVKEAGCRGAASEAGQQVGKDGQGVREINDAAKAAVAAGADAVKGAAEATKAAVEKK